VVKRLLDILQLRMRRNGYLGASGQKSLTPPFALANFDFEQLLFIAER